MFFWVLFLSCGTYNVNAYGFFIAFYLSKRTSERTHIRAIDTIAKCCCLCQPHCKRCTRFSPSPLSLRFCFVSDFLIAINLICCLMNTFSLCIALYFIFVWNDIKLWKSVDFSRRCAVYSVNVHVMCRYVYVCRYNITKWQSTQRKIVSHLKT